MFVTAHREECGVINSKKFETGKLRRSVIKQNPIFAVLQGD
jgi:hypothetical protein